MKKTIIIIFAIIVGLAFLLVSITANCQQWKPNPKYITAQPVKDTTDKIQCSGTTKKGERCKNKGKHQPYLRDGIFLCHNHINQQ